MGSQEGLVVQSREAHDNVIQNMEGKEDRKGRKR
jgi:hypothetical protein